MKCFFILPVHLRSFLFHNVCPSNFLILQHLWPLRDWLLPPSPGENNLLQLYGSFTHFYFSAEIYIDTFHILCSEYYEFRSL